MDILSKLVLIASKVSASISKPSWLANLIARIILKGSSEKVISGFKGVLINFFFISVNPSNGSTSSPNVFLFKLTASALIVKSLRF